MKTAFVTTLETDQVKDLRWVLAARAVDPLHEVLTGLLLETAADGGRTLVATDGRRVHALPATDWQGLPDDGVWRVRIVRGLGEVWTKIDGTYPQWRQVTAMHEPRRLPAFEAPDQAASILLSRAALIGCPLAPKLAMDACACRVCLLEIAFGTVNDRYDRSFVTARFEDSRFAVLMPVRDERWCDAADAAERVRFRPAAKGTEVAA